MKITVPIPEKISFNKIYAGVHWAKRKAWADDYHLAVLLAARQSGKTAYSGTFPVNVEYRFKLSGKGLDSTNLALMVKFLEDGLVSSGVIPDDSPQYVRSTKMTTDSGDGDEVEIEISPTSRG